MFPNQSGGLRSQLCGTKTWVFCFPGQGLFVCEIHRSSLTTLQSNQVVMLRCGCKEIHVVDCWRYTFETRTKWQGKQWWLYRTAILTVSFKSTAPSQDDSRNWRFTEIPSALKMVHVILLLTRFNIQVFVDPKYHISRYHHHFCHSLVYRPPSFKCLSSSINH